MSIKIVPEYERGVIFRLGRIIGAKGPGLFLIIPVVDRMIRVSLRTVTMDIPPQDVITKDNVTVRVNAVTTSTSSTPTAPSWPSRTTSRALHRLPRRHCAASSAKSTSMSC
ncbi:SPFH domain-containing protein [Streptomyces sp. NPDC004647]|uniref:SPFH domain-containing protein n=1 Tax=Streptomyces sp. NPDC004647 TaxID=3154671 RepID=UPI0033B5F6A8